MKSLGWERGEERMGRILGGKGRKGSDLTKIYNTNKQIKQITKQNKKQFTIYIFVSNNKSITTTTK